MASDHSTGKKNSVRKMFNGIAGKYDFLNHFLSAGIDRRWRKQAIRKLAGYSPRNILDVATGTADFALEAVRLDPETIVGIDIADEMLEIGRKKISRRGLEGLIQLKNGDSEDIPFPDRSFDAVIVAFGVRNFEDLERGLAEMHRVLNDRGVVIILEFSLPQRFPVRQLYSFYFRKLLPAMGRLISGDRSAYSYLPDSVYEFPEGNDFLDILKDRGFSNVNQKRLTAGIATIYSGEKKEV